MYSLFQYNWQIRNEWFELLGELNEAQLNMDHIGGLGSIPKTLFHIVDTEYSWLRALKGEPDLKPEIKDYNTIASIKDLSAVYHTHIEEIIQFALCDLSGMAEISWAQTSFSYDHILKHVLTHEVYHIGQLSVWAKAMNLRPIDASYMGRSSAFKNT